VIAKRFLITAILFCCFMGTGFAEIYLGQGTMSGEVTSTSVLLQTRLTVTEKLDEKGDIPGAAGVVNFRWSRHQDFRDAQTTPPVKALPRHDFIVRTSLQGLEPATTYYFRAVFGDTPQSTQEGPVCSFKTLPGAGSDNDVRFIVGSCMNYNKFMYGKAGKAGDVITATEEDKRLGFPAFVAMKRLQPDFFVGTGDIVYYDNQLNDAQQISELRQCWHEQFRFPRMIEFFRDVPGYWSKDDHDFRFNDSDNSSDRLPMPATGIELFREQVPIAAMDDHQSPTYRTHRVNQSLQIWLTEGRDFRSPNRMADGPEKTLWGAEQSQWLRKTLKASDAKWKILISPTPMVGPDDAKKKDNHTNLGGFRHEAEEFFDWMEENKIDNLMTICGDRHWQYHSIHPKGINEFACGALNDENARVGVAPGSRKGTDPEGLIEQPYTYPSPTGGFIMVEAGDELVIQFFDDQGEQLYRVVK
tara:strand:+ start:409011 stop:410423 length:1413 start_codon:yes stop_codon:yes gene_type:complete